MRGERAARLIAGDASAATGAGAIVANIDRNRIPVVHAVNDVIAGGSIAAAVVNRIDFDVDIVTGVEPLRPEVFELFPAAVAVEG